MVKQIVILRAALGWQAGIVVGMYGALAVMIYMPMNIYLKVFTVIGLFSASLGTLYSIYETWKQYKMAVAIENIQKDTKEVNKENANNTKEKS